jgi:hypothetical protein
MKMAKSAIVVDDFDFVFVEKEFEDRSTDADDADDEDDDAESYDYCEDVYSISSNSNEQEENDDDVLLLSDNIDEKISSPSTGLKDSALTVPSILLKDLDEAHEAAKLTLMTDLEGVNDLATTCSDDEHGIDGEEKDTLSSPSPQILVLKDLEQPEKEKIEETETSKLQESPPTVNNNNTDCIGIEDSPALVLSTKSSETNTITEIVNPASRKTTILILPAAEPKNSSSSGEIKAAAPCFLLTHFPTMEEKQSSGDKLIGSTSNNTNKTTSAPASISRASNKKRRKKLKLLKKAQAAEKFQQQVAFANLSSPSQGKVSKKFLKHSKKTPSRCGSKKVANIAVSCAMESMSSYRKELSRQQGKQ